MPQHVKTAVGGLYGLSNEVIGICHYEQIVCVMCAGILYQLGDGIIVSGGYIKWVFNSSNRIVGLNSDNGYNGIIKWSKGKIF